MFGLPRSSPKQTNLHGTGPRAAGLAWTMLGLVALLLGACSKHNARPDAEPVVLLNVSYDPTRELYADFNKLFAGHLASAVPRWQR
jgi:ABC-type sulfate transport system substrate-binding protein